MKKFIYSAMAVAMLATTSCKDDLAESFVGEEATVEFSISTPEIATRAFSEGKEVDHLHYAIYEVEGQNLIKTSLYGIEDFEQNSRVVNLSLPLKTGKEYKAIFWADDEQAPYSVTFSENGATMEVNYTDAKANDERRDAFYACVPVVIRGNESKTVTLTRPFAQLNIGTNDYTAAKMANYEPKYSKVVVKQLKNQLNLLTGAVEGSPADITFGYSVIPNKQDGYVAENKENFPVTGYEYLAMNYLLVGADQEVVDIEFAHNTVNEANGETTKTVGSVPVRRNYRTNIYGKLLTSDNDFEVEINPDYEVGTLVYDKQTLQDAINAAPADETTTIYLGATIEGDVIEYQKTNRNVIIDGMGNKWNGTIKIHNGSNYNNGSITIKNVNFETSDDKRNFIEALENGSERYSNNITVEGCTFTSPATRSSINEGVVGVQVKATRGVTVKDCTATNIHSLIQAQSCDTGDVKVQKCTVNGCKNGVAFKQVKAATVEGCTITAAEYGIRFDGNTDNYGIIVKDNEVNAKQPFIVRKMTGKNNTITLEDENTLNVDKSVGKPYQIVITNGSDDEEYVKPTGTYTLTGAGGYKMFPELPVAKIGTTEYTSIDDAIANWTNNTTLTLLADVTLTNVVTLKSTEHHILDLGTYTMTAAEDKNAFVIQACGTGDSERSAITIKADANNPGGINAGSKCIVYYKYADGGISGNDRPIIKIEGGVFTGSTSSWGTAGIYAIGTAARKCATLHISGGTFNCAIYGSGKSKLLISGGTFNYSVGSQGDSTALRLIWGGKFKTLGFMTADSNNTKFWFGTSMANSNVGLYIDDEGYLIVGGPVITEFGDKFAAKATNPTKWNSLLQYSSAAEHGLYFTKAKVAEDHNKNIFLDSNKLNLEFPQNNN